MPLDETDRDRVQRAVLIDYTNHSNNRRPRRILPRYMYFGSNKYHTLPQWLLVAEDLDRAPGTLREFALKDIHSWE